MACSTSDYILGRRTRRDKTLSGRSQLSGRFLIVLRSLWPFRDTSSLARVLVLARLIGVAPDALLADLRESPSDDGPMSGRSEEAKRGEGLS